MRTKNSKKLWEKLKASTFDMFSFNVLLIEQMPILAFTQERQMKWKAYQFKINSFQSDHCLFCPSMSINHLYPLKPQHMTRGELFTFIVKIVVNFIIITFFILVDSSMCVYSFFPWFTSSFCFLVQGLLLTQRNSNTFSLVARISQVTGRKRNENRSLW